MRARLPPALASACDAGAEAWSGRDGTRRLLARDAERAAFLGRRLPGLRRIRGRMVLGLGRNGLRGDFPPVDADPFQRVRLIHGAPPVCVI